MSIWASGDSLTPATLNRKLASASTTAGFSSNTLAAESGNTLVVNSVLSVATLYAGTVPISALDLASGSAVDPSLGFQSEQSLGLYRSGASTIAQSYGTFSVTNLGGTLSTATQPNVTTMAGLVTVGALASGSIASGFGAINIGANALTCGAATVSAAVAVARLVLTSAGGSGRSYELRSLTDGRFMVFDATAVSGRVEVSATGAWDFEGNAVAMGALTASGLISANAGLTVASGQTLTLTGATITGFTGNITGNCSGSAATVTGAAQSAITSLGTLTSLTTGAITLTAAAITRNTSDGADNSYIEICGGGGVGTDRGAAIVFNGNENGGVLILYSGGIAGSYVKVVDVGNTEVARFDDSAVAGNTRLMLYDVDNATLERVTVGAAESGGAGYKLLRIPN